MEYKMEDISKLIKVFEKLEEKVQSKIAWGATKKAAAVIKDNAIKNAMMIDDPKTKERIVENMHIQKASKIAKKEKAVAYRVGVLGGASYDDGEEGNPGGATFYWRFIEFGTSKVKARPFLRPAASESVGKVMHVLENEMWDRMLKELKKR